MKDKIILIILEILRKILCNYTFKIRHGLAKGFKRRFGLGFKPKFRLTEEETFLANHNFKEMIIFDIGGYVGIHSIFFANAVGENGRIITFEPNPYNYREIIFNLKINNFKNFRVIPLGVGKKKDILELIIDPIHYSRGTFKKKKILKSRYIKTCKILVKNDSIDNLIKKKNLPPPNFVKIDVEGFECEVIQGMNHTIENYKPKLFIEIHEELTKKLINLLVDNMYKFYHVELKEKISSNNLEKVSKGHIYCY